MSKIYKLILISIVGLLAIYTIFIVYRAIPVLSNIDNYKPFKFTYTNEVTDFKGNKMDIKASKSDLEIEGIDGDNIILEGTVIIKAKNKAEAEELYNNCCNFKMKNDKVLLTMEDFKKNGIVTTSSSLNLKVPKQVKVNVNVESGDVKAKHLEQGLYLNVKKGDFTVEDIEGLMEWNLTTGDINADRLNGKISLTAIDSNITLNELSVTSESEISLKNGNIEISVNEENPINILAKTVVGNIGGNRAWTLGNSSYYESKTDSNAVKLILDNIHGNITVDNF